VADCCFVATEVETKKSRSRNVAVILFIDDSPAAMAADLGLLGDKVITQWKLLENSRRSL
jgi:hypothetical protein